MTRKSRLVISTVLLSIVLVLTSCFEIIEEVNLNSDGSGDFCFTINMSKSKTQINSMLLLDSINGKPVPKKEDFKKAIKRVKLELEKDSAISDTKVTENWDDFIFSISGDFKNVDALNKAIKNINTVFNTPRGYSAQLYDNFKFENGVFERLYSYNLVNDYNSMSEKDKTVFKNAKYTTIYRFKTPVKRYTNTNALKSKSGKAILLKVNVRELITNKKTIKNTIYLN